MFEDVVFNDFIKNDFSPESSPEGDGQVASGSASLRAPVALETEEQRLMKGRFSCCDLLPLKKRFSVGQAARLCNLSSKLCHTSSLLGGRWGW